MNTSKETIAIIIGIIVIIIIIVVVVLIVRNRKNNKQGFDLHLVLIYDYDGVNLILHDPGLPPIKSRRVTIDEFKKCFNYPGANCGITIFSK